MEQPPDHVTVVDDDGDSLELKCNAGEGRPFPLLATVVEKETGDVGQVYLTEESVRELLSWLSDTITT